MEQPEVLSRLLEAVRKERQRARAENSTTGHSHGGPLAGVATAASDVLGVGFSSPGLFYQPDGALD